MHRTAQSIKNNAKRCRAESTISYNIKKYFWLFFIILASVSAAAFFSLTCIKAIWYDEVFTMDMLRYGFLDICKNTAADVHPPLYYLLLKLFMLPFGQNETAARIFSVIPFMVIIIWGGLQVKKLFSETAALLFMLAFTAYPSMMYYSVEIRMYSLAAMLVFMNGIFAYRFLIECRASDRIGLVITGTAAAYTHYYALISIGIIYAILLAAIIVLKQRTLKQWIICSAATALLYIPWLKFFSDQLIYKVNNEYWIPPLSFTDIYNYLIIPLLICLALYTVTYFIHNKKLLITVIALTAVRLGTIAVGVLASVLIRPVFIMRYTVQTVPLFALAIALIFSQIKHRAVTAGFLILSVISGIHYYRTEFSEKYINVDGRFNARLMSRYTDCDCYIIYPDNMDVYMHAKCILLFYGRAVPLYLYEGNDSYAFDPSDNVKNVLKSGSDDIEYTDAEALYSQYDNIMLITRQDADVPEELAEHYNCELTDRAATTYRATVEDIYVLTK